MENKVKLRVTITWTFEAKPEYYGPEVNTPEKMAEVEQGQENIEAMLAIGMEQDDFEFTVKPERE